MTVKNVLNDTLYSFVMEDMSVKEIALTITCTEARSLQMTVITVICMCSESLS